MTFDTVNYLNPTVSPMFGAVHDGHDYFLQSPNLLFSTATVSSEEDFYESLQTYHQRQSASIQMLPYEQSMTPGSRFSSLSGPSQVHPGPAWSPQNEAPEVFVNGWCVDRSGVQQTLQNFSENHRIVRPDDTVHAELCSSEDILLLLSDPAPERTTPNASNSNWIGQLNGRAHFKVSNVPDEEVPVVQKMRLNVLTHSNSRHLDFKTDMKCSILSISGHLAIMVKKHEPFKVALILPTNMAVTSNFKIVLGLLPAENEEYEDMEQLPFKENYLTLSDCTLPMEYTTKYPGRPRKRSSRTSSRGTIGNVS